MHSKDGANLRAIGSILICALATYVATTFIVVTGALGIDTGGKDDGSDGEDAASRVWHNWLTGGDGYHFLEIARNGYTFNPDVPSPVAFFPILPLSGWGVNAVTGLKVEEAILLAAHGYLLGAFVLLAIYSRQRYGDAATSITRYALLAFGLFPTTFFFRMNYSESSFLFFAILAMVAMERRWPLVPTALIVGFATATRPVGVALVPVFCMSLWQRSVGLREIAFRSLILLPLALCGLIGYMFYQYLAFDQPFGFAMTQQHWSFRTPVSFDEKVLAVLSHEPVWSVYDTSSEAYWQRTQPIPHAWDNLALANPLYFLFGVALVIAGRWKNWLNRNETVLAALLILIPYVTRGFEMCMLSQGRFVAAVFPIYLVIGHLLSKCPVPCAVLLLCISGLVMAIYAAQFAAGYMLI